MMTGALIKTVGVPALLAAGLLVTASLATAQAADLGGDCCADLEERIAELEATTARKGNRKVSLEVSGHINEAILFFDDGYESNTYVVGNDQGRSRFRFTGKAKISSDWEAGYLLEIGVRSSRSDRVSQSADEGAGNGLDLRHSSWFLKSKTFGTLVVGQTDSAAEGITEINLSQTKDISKGADIEDFVGGFRLRTTSGVLSTITYNQTIKANGDLPGEGNRNNAVRYVSPSFAGFTTSASYGEDDYWDVALRYAGSFSGFKLAAGIAYGRNTEGGTSASQLQCVVTADNAECEQFGGSLSIVHEASGLFVNGGGGWYEDEQAESLFAGADSESTFYWVQGGIEQKWLPIGKTTIYADYLIYDGGVGAVIDAAGANGAFGVNAAGRFFDSEVEAIGGGIVQGIDAAAMSLYLTYKHVEVDATFRRNDNGATTKGSFEDLDLVMGGALIKF